jgi:hypothetical protein
MSAYVREELLALTTAEYLAEGYVRPDGALRRAFLSDYATTAGTQFLAADVSPQELSLIAQTVRQFLPMSDGAPGQRARAAVDRALGVIAHAIRQRSSAVLKTWLHTCAAAVVTEVDLAMFLAHLLATERQYGLLAYFSQQPEPTPPNAPPPLAA